MKVDLAYLENLSKLKIKDEDREKFADEFSSVLDFVDEIAKLDLSDTEKEKAVKLCELREDKIDETKEPCDVLMNAPKKKDGCYQTPLVVE